jgi:putative addiction module component (TIGR02574 family)
MPLRSVGDNENYEAAAMSNLRNEIELSLTDVQRDELDYRLGQYERNPDEVIPWEEVRAGLFKKQ